MTLVWYRRIAASDHCVYLHIYIYVFYCTHHYYYYYFDGAGIRAVETQADFHAILSMKNISEHLYQYIDGMNVPTTMYTTLDTRCTSLHIDARFISIYFGVHKSDAGRRRVKIEN